MDSQDIEDLIDDIDLPVLSDAEFNFFFAKEEEEEDQPFICDLCRKEFAHKKNLYRHIKHLHSSDSKTFVCEVCSMNFTYFYKLRNHLTHIHGGGSDMGRRAVECPICSKKQQSSTMHKHFESEHDISLVSEDVSFKSAAEFEKWKRRVEKSTSSRYVKKQRTYVVSGTSRKMTYYCHRSGCYKPRGTKTKSQGSNKIMAYCPAKMEMIVYSDGSVVGRFIKTHVGHDCEPKATTKSPSKQSTTVTPVKCSAPENDASSPVEVLPSDGCEFVYRLFDESDDGDAAKLILIAPPSTSPLEERKRRVQATFFRLTELAKSDEQVERLELLAEHAATLLTD